LHSDDPVQRVESDFCAAPAATDFGFELVLRDFDAFRKVALDNFDISAPVLNKIKGKSPHWPSGPYE
jgi:hypothetical protein